MMLPLKNLTILKISVYFQPPDYMLSKYATEYYQNRRRLVPEMNFLVYIAQNLQNFYRVLESLFEDLIALIMQSRF